jgi:hypothetical protein
MAQNILNFAIPELSSHGNTGVRESNKILAGGLFREVERGYILVGGRAEVKLYG